MASIGSLGIGSGMDLNGLLDKLRQAESAPLQAIANRQASVSSQLSAFGTVQGLLANLKSASDKLGDATFMNSCKSSSSAAGILTTAADATAAAGTYSVVVSHLAQAQSLASGGVATTTDAIGAGAATITIDFGTVAGSLDAGTGTFTNPGTTFTADASKKQITVSLQDGKTSLAQVRDAINAAAGTALTASIVNDGSGNRLVLAAAQTGASSSMKVTVSDGSGGAAANGAIAALLGNDPQGTQALRQTVAAQDAALSVNGIGVTSAGNTVTGAIQGVTLNLLDSGTSTVSVSRDTGSVQSAINDFVGAYNRLNTIGKQLGAYGTAGTNGGPLAGNATLRMIQERLRSTLFTSRAGQSGDPTRLSDIGVAFQKDGSLAVTSAKLTSALTGNPGAVARLLAGDAVTPGVADNFSSVIDGFTADNIDNAKDGLLTVALNGAQQTVARLGTEYQTASDRLDSRMAVYRAQFTQLDMVMGGLTATSNYLTTQLSALNSKSK